MSMKVQLRRRTIKVPEGEFNEMVDKVISLGVPRRLEDGVLRRPDDVWLYGQRLKALGESAKRSRFQVAVRWTPRPRRLFLFYLRHPKTFVQHQLAVAEAHDHVEELRADRERRQAEGRERLRRALESESVAT